MDVVTAAGLDILAAPCLWAIAAFPLAAPALVVLVSVGWTGVAQGGRWWVSALQPGLGLAVPWLYPGAPTCPGLMHQFADPLHGLERIGTALASKLGCCGVGKTPSQGWTGVKVAACPARGCVGWCVPLHNCYTKERAVLGPVCPVCSQIVNCLVQLEV